MATMIRSPGLPQLGSFQLIERIGAGGMADVYLARAHGTAGFSRLVALKVLRPSLSRDADFRAMFVQEARIAARLTHPNVVQTYDVGEEGDLLFLAMELLEGDVLSRVLGKAGPPAGGLPTGSRAVNEGVLPLSARLLVVADVLAGLHHAHEARDFDGRPLQLVHRDISPQNVFVTLGGHAKLLDFGIAKCAESLVETRAGILKGKVRYMAPEQFHGGTIDRRADVYSAGVVLWECVTGQRLWEGLDLSEVAEKVRRGEVPLPTAIVPSLPAVLDELCSRAMSPAIADRYPDALAMARDIHGAIDALGGASDHTRIGAAVEALFPELRARNQARFARACAVPAEGGKEDLGAEALRRSMADGRHRPRFESLTPLSMEVESSSAPRTIPEPPPEAVKHWGAAAPAQRPLPPVHRSASVLDASFGADLFDRHDLFAQRVEATAFSQAWPVTDSQVLDVATVGESAGSALAFVSPAAPTVPLLPTGGAPRMGHGGPPLGRPRLAGPRNGGGGGLASTRAFLAATLAIVGAVVAVGAGSWLGRQLGDRPASAGAALGAEASAGADVRVRVQVTPLDAQVYVGDRRDPVHATEFVVPKAPSVTRIRVVRPGYRTRVLEQPFDRQTLVVVDLAPDLASGPAIDLPWSGSRP